VDVSATFSEASQPVGEVADTDRFADSGCGGMIAEGRVWPVPDHVVRMVGSAVQHLLPIGLDKQCEPGLVDPGVVEEVRILAERVNVVDVVLRRLVIAHDQDCTIGH